ncbi:DsbA family oxidoreductase [Erysipelothrix rhusiopathiae]|uniref:DsbA family oxidoreductase n=1 Tax=Erysipelothrix rhusiopathiae TaxID=1648 RepID=UPI00202B5C15|nr:DsbA family oxidoreductase [Erysipelothrix rhusiopathiae]URQ77446.1 DsbA family oxidoreductase [Erysipelothrix rhusiopathiae]
MKVQVWSDFVCPFCYVGKRHLEEAIKQLDKDIEVEFMSFELDQNYVDNPDLNIHEMLAQKYNISVDEARMNNERVGSMAQSVGLNYDFDVMKYTNTFKAHKVFQYAKLKGLGNEYSEMLMDAYFSKGVYLNDLDALIEMGASIGLDAEGIKYAFESDEYGLSVRQDEQWAQMIGARGVPHFVIDDQVSLSGAQPIETFKSAIQHVETLNAQKNDSMMCTDGVCTID